MVPRDEGWGSQGVDLFFWGGGGLGGQFFGEKMFCLILHDSNRFEGIFEFRPFFLNLLSR